MPQRNITEAFPPGEFIQEELEARGWSQIELAEVIGCHPTIVNAWIKGKRAITPQTAKQLGDAFGTSAQLWMNLQTYYDLWKEEEVDVSIARRAKLYDYAPIKEMIKRQWIEPSENIEVMEQRVLKIYGVSSLDERPDYAYAARKSTPGDLNPSQLAWFCRARQLSRCVQAARFTEQSFQEALRALKPLMSRTEEIRRIPHLLASFGIRFLIVEHLPRTRIDGVTFWLDAQSPVIVLSMRFDRIDWFWFTLGHELGHVDKKDGLNKPIYIDTDLVGEDAQRFEEKSEAEKQADLFSAAFLVDQNALESFIRRKGPLFSKVKIARHAMVQGVHPGLIVGQLHHRGLFHWSYYRQMLDKVRDIITASALTDGWGQLPPANV